MVEATAPLRAGLLAGNDARSDPRLHRRPQAMVVNVTAALGLGVIALAYIAAKIIGPVLWWLAQVIQ